MKAARFDLMKDTARINSDRSKHSDDISFDFLMRQPGSSRAETDISIGAKRSRDMDTEECMLGHMLFKMWRFLRPEIRPTHRNCSEARNIFDSDLSERLKAFVRTGESFRARHLVVLTAGAM